MKYPLIETERLFLRRPDARDQDLALRFFGTRRPRLASAPLAGGQAWRQLATFLGHWETEGHGLFAVVPAGEEVAIGLVGPWHPAGWPEPEVGWLVWSQSPEATELAAEAVAAACRFARACLGRDDVVSYVAGGDAASAGLALSLGDVADPFAPRPDGADCHVYCHPPLRRAMDRAA